MSRVFLNYRNGDEPYAAMLIGRVLTGWFGAGTAFRASDCIAPGDDYVAALVAAVRRCEVMLAVIGERWLPLLHQRVRPGGSASRDWVYRELALGFAEGKRVIPVLIGPVRLPGEHELPSEIAPLARCQYRRLEHRQFDAGMYQLAVELSTLMPGLPDMGNGKPVLLSNGAGETLIGLAACAPSSIGSDDRPWPTTSSSSDRWRGHHH